MASQLMLLFWDPCVSVAAFHTEVGWSPAVFKPQLTLYPTDPCLLGLEEQDLVLPTHALDMMLQS